ncbi:MAG: acyl carrier protein [Clostridiaceae bacterium]|nr:acyl carrier protein [Clostridiaceae bacterium]
MEQILEILNDLHPEVDFTTQTGLIDNKILDSFDIVSIVTEISNEFDIAVPAEEIIPDNFNSAQSLQAMIDRLLDE